MDVELIIPDEPKVVKNLLSVFLSQEKDKQKINWSSTYIWSGNKLPQYLWSKWRNDLNKKGFSWHIFLRLMKSRNYEAILWANEKISWDEYILEIIDSVYGPLGQILSGKKKPLQSKHLCGKVIQIYMNKTPHYVLELPHRPDKASLSFHFDQIFNDYLDKDIKISIREINSL